MGHLASERGVINLAPFSCFTFVSNKPPMLGINVGRKAGKRKDTGANIHALSEFVVNIGDASQMIAIHESSAEHAPDVSETELLGLATLPCNTMRVPAARRRAGEHGMPPRAGDPVRRHRRGVHRRRGHGVPLSRRAAA